MNWPSNMDYDDVIRELVKLHSPKTYLHMGSIRGRILEGVLAYKSINRMVLCLPEENGVEETLSGMGFLGEVEWYYGSTAEIFAKNTFAHSYDMVIVDGPVEKNLRYADLTVSWKLCKSVLVVHNTCYSAVTAFGLFVGSSIRKGVGLARYTGGEGTMVVTR